MDFDDENSIKEKLKEHQRNRLLHSEDDVEVSC